MSTIKPVSVPSKRLASSINASSLTIQLDNITGWDGNNLTSSDFGSVLYAVLRNEANTLMELIEIDPSTIADSSITVLRRGLKFDGDLTTEVSANKLTWVKNETIIELGSNPPQLLKHFVDDLQAQTIAGVKTFTSTPINTGGNPTTDTELATKAYVDLVGTGSASMNRMVIAGNAGETVAAGNLVYFDTTDNEWKLCDADTAASVDNVLLGIAQGAGTDGNAISGGVLLMGLDSNQSGMTAGDIMYVGNTAGAISSSVGTTEVTVGIAKSATELYFFPRLNQQITENEQDALAGTSGTPKSTNKFLTENDTTNAATITGTGISFDAASKEIRDSGNGFVTAGFRAGQTVAVTGTSNNNGNFTIVSVAAGVLVVEETVVDESAGGSFTVAAAKNNKALRLNGSGALPAVDGSSLTGVAKVIDIQVFTSSGTWTKPTGAKIVDVYLIGGGGGGGSGAIFNSSNDSGGGGGGGGALSYKRFAADLLAATATVTVGTGGVGGAAKSTGDQAGNAGNAGNDSTFVSGGETLLVAKGGGGGGGGNTTSGTAGTGGAATFGDFTQAGGDGGAGDDTATASTGTDSATAVSPRGGGGGGGVNGGTNGTAGGAGGAFITNYVLAGGAGGAVATGGSVGNNVSSNHLNRGGTGGGGGGGANSPTPGNGAAGGDGGNYGGGGGGGGAGDNSGGSGSEASGKGGDGADGLCVVITYF